MIIGFCFKRDVVIFRYAVPCVIRSSWARKKQRLIFCCFSSRPNESLARTTRRPETSTFRLFVKFFCSSSSCLTRKKKHKRVPLHLECPTSSRRNSAIPKMGNGTLVFLGGMSGPIGIVIYRVSFLFFFFSPVVFDGLLQSLLNCLFLLGDYLVDVKRVLSFACGRGRWCATVKK